MRGALSSFYSIVYVWLQVTISKKNLKRSSFDKEELSACLTEEFEQRPFGRCALSG